MAPAEKEILISSEAGETRIAVREEGVLVEYYEQEAEANRVAGNIYKGKVENVLPGMQAAFVNVGVDRNAYLYVDDAYPVALEEFAGELPDELRLRRRRQAIGELLRSGQEVVVQVVKEPVGTKGARVTRNLTLPGRFFVLLPGVDYVAVSHRITGEKERERLRGMARRLRPRKMGLIVRTAAEGRAEADLADDVRSLRRLWTQIRQRSRRRKPPALLHRDQDAVYRLLRDALSSDVTAILVDEKEEFLRVRELLRLFAPELVERLSLYEKLDTTLFADYGVDEELQRALSRRIWLKNGAYIVIDHAEALTAIDVNTGRFVGSTSLEETVLETNLVAAKEIARQIRLRDVGGILVIDFIDMNNEKNREQVIAKLEEHMRRDRTRGTVLGITQLGLVEVTRKKRRQSLPDLLTRPCTRCGGSGRVTTEPAAARSARRQIHRLLREADSAAILVEIHPSVASLLIGPGGSNLRELERLTGKSIFIRGSEECQPEELKLVVMGTREEVQERALPVRAGQVLELKVEEPHAANTGDGIARLEGYVIDIEGAADRIGQKIKVEITRAFRTYAKAKIVV